ncbi:hypothetical protein GV67_08360 [Pseudorhizobium pelagicum]|uniref:Uncharacterized protein n=1 Tax=Pseudorhizobium pelagicum TaxID=1509405 RepID=A0A922P2X0_9HYPH|nr:hypothetical protein GV67_08360 [Pseudorhizobium pelagicum]KEQ06666.1 hypothetical protein GV68_06335 [Pseudorhizobium pelagicum]
MREVAAASLQAAAEVGPMGLTTERTEQAEEVAMPRQHSVACQLLAALAPIRRPTRVAAAALRVTPGRRLLTAAAAAAAPPGA